MSLSKQLRDAADHQLHAKMKQNKGDRILYSNVSQSLSALDELSVCESTHSNATNSMSVTSKQQKLPQLKQSRSSPSQKGSSERIPHASKTQFERLSGLYDYSVSAGVFADPTITTKPSTRCVRCANHASLCMPCTEYLCDEALTFYRKTRARGAIKLFQNAVTEAGLGRLLKFTLFRMWRNVVLKWKQQMMKKKYIVERMFGINVTAVPFKAWQQYTRQTKISRRDHKIAELHAKVETLTESMAQLSEANSEFTRQAQLNAYETNQLLSKIAEQDALIAKLRGDLKQERERVVGLSSLAEPVSVLMTLSEEIRSSVSVLVKNQLLEDRGFCIEYTPHAFSDMTVSKKYDEIEDKDSGFSGESGPHAAPSKYVIKKWLYDKGREASLRVEPVSQTPLDVFLPEQPEVAPTIGVAYDLTDAKLLIRAVVCLCYDVFDDTSAGDGQVVEAGVTNKPTIPMHTLEEIKALRKKSPLSMMRIVTRLAHDYLTTPLFKANELSRGDPNIMNTFIGYLMLTEAPVRPQYTNIDISKFLGEYEHMQRNVINARTKTEAILDKLFKLQNTWAEATDQTVIQNIVASSHEGQHSHHDHFKKSSKILSLPPAPGPDSPAGPTAGGAAESSGAGGEASSDGGAEEERDATDTEHEGSEGHPDDTQSKPGSSSGKKHPKSSKVKFSESNKKGQESSKKSQKSKKLPKHKSIKEKDETDDNESEAESSGNQDGVTAEEAAPEEVIVKPSQEELYSKLTGEVDTFLSVYNNKADYDNGLLGSVQEMGRDLIRMLTLRSKLVSWQTKRQKGMRLASDGHRAAAAYILESLSNKFEWIISELDDKFENRANRKMQQQQQQQSKEAAVTAAAATVTNIENVGATPSPVTA